MFFNIRGVVTASLVSSTRIPRDLVGILLRGTPFDTERKLTPLLRFAVSLAALSLLAANRPCGAQRAADLVAGARVRVDVDRATNDGIRRYFLAGSVVAADSERIVLRTERQSAAPDTVLLFGVRRLEAFQGLRSRRGMVATGALVGGIAATVAWVSAKQMVRPIRRSVEISGSSPIKYRTVSEPVPSIVHALRNAIPFSIAGGALVGGIIGRERWTRIPVPESTFPQAR
jgi:hypothetical protein